MIKIKINDIPEFLDKLQILNRYAKYSDFFYDDRQGLYQIKKEIIKFLYENNIFTKVYYVDGKDKFAPFNTQFHIDNVIHCYFEADCAEKDGEYYSYGGDCPDNLYFLIFGEKPRNPQLTDEKIEIVKTYLTNRFNLLQQQAIDTDSPIKIVDLEELFWEPFDMLGDHCKTYDSWNNIDPDLFVLDPEGLSLVEFEHGKYSFHLPYRSAIEFVDPNIVKNNTKYREKEFYGSEITDDEMEENHIFDILEYFGIYNLDSYTFPRFLQTKSEYFQFKNYFDED